MNPLEPAGHWPLVALNVHPRVAMQILRHTQIAVTCRFTAKCPPRPHETRSGASARAWTGQLLLLHLVLHNDH